MLDWGAEPTGQARVKLGTGVPGREEDGALHPLKPTEVSSRNPAEIVLILKMRKQAQRSRKTEGHGYQ